MIKVGLYIGLTWVRRMHINNDLDMMEWIAFIFDQFLSSPFSNKHSYIEGWIVYLTHPTRNVLADPKCSSPTEYRLTPNMIPFQGALYFAMAWTVPFWQPTKESPQSLLFSKIGNSRSILSRAGGGQYLFSPKGFVILEDQRSFHDGLPMILFLTPS